MILNVDNHKKYTQENSKQLLKLKIKFSKDTGYKSYKQNMSVQFPNVSKKQLENIVKMIPPTITLRAKIKQSKIFKDDI